MTLNQFQFDSLSSGSTATTGSTGAAAVSTGNGGTVTHQSAGAARGTACGIRFLATGASSVADLRYTVPTSSNYALEFVLTVPAVLPSSDLTFFQFNATAARAFTILIRSTGLIRILDHSNSTRDTYTVTAGTKYRIALYNLDNSAGGTTDGKLTMRIYTETGTSPLGTYAYTNLDLSSGGFGGATSLRPGATGWPSEGCAGIYIDDFQYNDGSLAEIGPIVAASSSLRPTAVDSNAGGWTNVGGAADGAAALSDESDVTYIQSPDNPTNKAIVLKFNGNLNSGQPSVQTDYQATAASPPTTLQIELLQGPNTSFTQIATRTINPTLTGRTIHSFQCTSGEAAAITDRTNLYVRYTASS